MLTQQPQIPRLRYRLLLHCRGFILDNLGRPHRIAYQSFNLSISKPSQ